MNNHDWQQISTCLNGPHIWKCGRCGEWTRSFDKPAPDSKLVDPDTGHRYSQYHPQCHIGNVFNGIVIPDGL